MKPTAGPGVDGAHLHRAAVQRGGQSWAQLGVDHPHHAAGVWKSEALRPRLMVSPSFRGGHGPLHLRAPLRNAAGAQVVDLHLAVAGNDAPAPPTTRLPLGQRIDFAVIAGSGVTRCRPFERLGVAHGRNVHVDLLAWLAKAGNCAVTITAATFLSCSCALRRSGAG